jgi:molybdopterin-guanine dinucleotide biosynthesis protein A
MQASGFVLAGGASKRMGRTQALPPCGEMPLVESVAGTTRDAAVWVALIGDPAQFGHLGLPVFADALPGCGPAGDPEPLCAVYHRRRQPTIHPAIRGKHLKMRDLVNEIGATTVPLPSFAPVNGNTPAERWQIEGGAA